MMKSDAVADVDWRAGLKALFDNGLMDFMAKNRRGFPLGPDRELMAWSDWLIGKIEEAALAKASSTLRGDVV